MCPLVQRLSTIKVYDPWNRRRQQLQQIGGADSSSRSGGQTAPLIQTAAGGGSLEALVVMHEGEKKPKCLSGKPAPPPTGPNIKSQTVLFHLVLILKTFRTTGSCSKTSCPPWGSTQTHGLVCCCRFSGCNFCLFSLSDSQDVGSSRLCKEHWRQQWMQFVFPSQREPLDSDVLVMRNVSNEGSCATKLLVRMGCITLKREDEPVGNTELSLNSRPSAPTCESFDQSGGSVCFHRLSPQNRTSGS